MHDPFAMRPFFGYNFGEYLSHWLSMSKPGRQMPKIFHVNWFRKDEQVIFSYFSYQFIIIDMLLFILTNSTEFLTFLSEILLNYGNFFAG